MLTISEFSSIATSTSIGSDKYPFYGKNSQTSNSIKPFTVQGSVAKVVEFVNKH